MCLQACIWKKLVSSFKGRPPGLLRGPKFQRQHHASPLSFLSLGKTCLAYSGIAHEEAGCRNVSDMTGCLPGFSSVRGLSTQSRSHASLGRKWGPLASKLPKAGTKLVLSEVEKSNWMDVEAVAGPHCFRPPTPPPPRETGALWPLGPGCSFTHRMCPHRSQEFS